MTLARTEVPTTNGAALERIAPWLFVAFWSTGFIAARYGTQDAGPLTFLTVRLSVAAVLLWIVAAATHAQRFIDARSLGLQLRVSACTRCIWVACL